MSWRDGFATTPSKDSGNRFQNNVFIIMFSSYVVTGFPKNGPTFILWRKKKKKKKTKTQINSPNLF